MEWHSLEWKEAEADVVDIVPMYLHPKRRDISSSQLRPGRSEKTIWKDETRELPENQDV